MGAVVHCADIQDRDGGVSLLSTLFGRFPFLERLFADSAYQGPIFAGALAQRPYGIKVEFIEANSSHGRIWPSYKSLQSYG
jgi:hypothetical protein